VDGKLAYPGRDNLPPEKGLQGDLQGFDLYLIAKGLVQMASLAVVAGVILIDAVELAGKEAAEVAGDVAGDVASRALQTGGNTIARGTADALNELAETSLAPRDWGRAVEALKSDTGLPSDFHGTITATGDYLGPGGAVEGNLLDYIK
jgi:hypothetical protein